MDARILIKPFHVYFIGTLTWSSTANKIEMLASYGTTHS